MKRSTLKAMRRTSPSKTTWLAMLGPCVAVPHGGRMAALVAFCARVHELERPVPDKRHRKLRIAVQFVNRRREQLAKQRVAPQLTALLWDSLAMLDPQRLEHLAAIVRRIRQYNADCQPAHPFHDKALRFADVLRLKHEIDPAAPWPVTRAKFLELLGVPEKEHDESSYERRELKRLRIVFAPDKRGPKKGTRKRGT